MNALTRRYLHALLCAVALGAAAGSALGQTAYPARAIRQMLGNTTGSGPDITSRLLGDYMSRALGQPWVVENRTGADSWIATEATARATPDGYTVLLANGATLTIDPHLKKVLPFDPVKELSFIAVVVDESAGMAVAVHPSLPVNTLSELITYARANPGKLSYGISTSLGNMLGKWLRRHTGIDLLEVPYKVSSQAIQDSVSGRVPVVLQSPTSLVAQARAGKLRLLALSTAARIKELPEVPTVAETFPNFSMRSFLILAGPVGVPREVIERLNREVAGALKDSKFTEALNRIWYFNLEGARTPAGAAEFVRQERETWGRFIRESGMQPE